MVALKYNDRTFIYRGVASALRVVHGRNSVESDIKARLIERNHQLDDLFEIKTLEMKVKIKNGKEAEEGEVLDDRGRKTVLKTGVSRIMFLLTIVQPIHCDN